MDTLIGTVIVGFLVVVWYLHVIADRLLGIANDIGSMTNHLEGWNAEMKLRNSGVPFR